MRGLLPALLSILIFYSLRVGARTYYVALNGSNSNPGTIAQPWRTVTYATGTSSGITAGDTILVRAGNYPENTVYLLVSGTASAPIVLKNYQDEVVTLDPGGFRLETGKNFWRLEGLTIMNTSGSSVSSGVIVSGTHLVGALTLSHCTIMHHKENGVFLGSPDFGGVAIYDCDIEWNGEIAGVPSGVEGSGIVMYGAHGILWARRNIIANNWAKGISHASEIPEFYGDSSVVDSNQIINNFESGMDWQADSSYIRYNYFCLNGTRDTEVGEWGDKGLAISSISTGNLVAWNIIKSSGNWELDPRGGGNKFYNNILIKDNYYSVLPGSPYSAAIILWDGNLPGNEFRNNIILNLCSQPEHHFVVLAELYQRYEEQIWSNNLYWAPNSTAASPYNRPFKMQTFPGGSYMTLAQVQANFPQDEIGSLYTNPGFVSLPDSNFNLVWGSPAIDAGTYVGFPFNSQAPDIGRFEYSEGNHPPWIEPVILDFIINEDQEFSYSLTPHEHDQEQSNSELIWSAGGLDPALASVAIDSATDLLTIVPVPDQIGSDVFTLTLSDGQGGQALQDVTLIINAVNDPPWIDPPIANLTTPEDSILSLDLTPYEHDGEQTGAQLTWSASGLNPSLATAAIDPATDLLTITPLPNQNGSDSFTLILEDGQGGLDSQAVTLTVQGINDPPWIDPPIANLTTPEDSAMTLDLTPYEHDGEQTSAQLTWAASGLNPVLATAAIDPLTDVLTITPLLNQNGSDSFTLILEDGQGGLDSQAVTLTVQGSNDPPWIDPPIANLTTLEDSVLTLDLTPYEHDPEQTGAQLTWTASGLNPGLAAVSIDAATDLLTLIPVPGQSGSDAFTLILTDGQGGMDLQQVSVNILAVNDPPWIDPPIANLTTPEDSILSLDLTPYEHDGEQTGAQLTWSASGLNPVLATAAIDPLTDVLTITPLPNQNGSDSFTLILSDGAGGLDSQAVTLTVQGANDPPWIDPPIANLTTPEDSILSLDLTPYEHDGEQIGAQLTWAASGLNPVLATVAIDPLTDVLTITPLPNQNGSDSFTLILSDGAGGLDSQAVTLTVQGTNDPPWIDPPIANLEIQGYESVLVSLAANGHDLEDPPETLIWEVEDIDSSLFTAGIDSSMQTLVITPVWGQNGADTARLILRDTGGLEAFQEVLFTLIGMGSSPGGPEIGRLPDINTPPGVAPAPLDLTKYVKCGEDPFDSLTLSTTIYNPQGIWEPGFVAMVKGPYLIIEPPSADWKGIRLIAVRAKDTEARFDEDTLKVLFANAGGLPDLPVQNGFESWGILETNQTVHGEFFQVHLATLAVPDDFVTFQQRGGALTSWRDAAEVDQFAFPLQPNSQNQLRLRIRYRDGRVGPEQFVSIIEDSTPPPKPTGLSLHSTKTGNSVSRSGGL